MEGEREEGEQVGWRLWRGLILHRSSEQERHSDGREDVDMNTTEGGQLGASGSLAPFREDGSAREWVAVFWREEGRVGWRIEHAYIRRRRQRPNASQICSRSPEP